MATRKTKTSATESALDSKIPRTQMPTFEELTVLETRENLNPFMQTGGLAFRAFSGIDEVGEIVGDLPISSVTIDSYAYGVRATSILESPIDVDALTRRLADPTTRRTVAEFIASDASMRRMLDALLPGNFKVSFGTPMFSRFTVFREAEKGGLNSQAAVVVSDMVIYALQPLGIVATDVERGHYTLEQHYGLIPKLEQVVSELIRVDVERNIEMLELSVSSSGRKHENNRIVIDRVLEKMRLVAAQLRRVGEVEAQFRDVLDLVRTRLNPEAYATAKVDKGLLDHPAIVDLASDATMVALALSIGRHQRSQSDAMLTMKLDTIIGRLRDITRYKRISASAFADRFTKRTVRTDKGRPLTLVVAQNVKGSPSAQVIDSLVYDEEGTRHQILTNPLVEGFLNSAQGEVMNYLSSSRSVALLASEIERFAGGSDFDFDGLLGGVHTLLIEDEMTLSVLAMCVAQRTVLLVTDSGRYALAYRADLSGVDYNPVSARVILDEAMLTDPSEALMLVEDFEGGFTEGDRVQVMPKQVLGNYVYGDSPFSEFVRLNKRMAIEVGDAVDTYKSFASFMELLGRDYIEDAALIIPALNRAVADSRWGVLLYLWGFADRIEGSAPAIASGVRRRMCRELAEFYKSFDGASLKQIESRIVDSLLVSVEGNRAKAASRLQRDIFRQRIRHLAAKIVSQRCGLLAYEGDTAGIIDSIMESEDYQIEAGIV